MLIKVVPVVGTMAEEMRKRRREEMEREGEGKKGAH